MANKDQFTAKQFIQAIKGSGGVISTIASRVGCSWDTAKKYLTEYATVRTAWENEKETTDDLAESVIINNIKLALRQQQAGEAADSSDSKWWIERRRRDKFSTRNEILESHTGKVEIEITYTDEIED